MTNKFIFMILFWLFPTLLCAADMPEYKAFADTWISTYVQKPNGQLRITSEELTILLNIIYFSYARSAATITAQDATLSAMKTSWQLVQNVTQTRRNPSKSIPYPQEPKSYGTCMKQAWNLQQEHERLGTTYATMLDYILKQDPTLTDHMRTSIEQLREQARVALLDSLTTVKDYIQSLIAACQKNPGVAEGDTNLPSTRSIAIIDYLISLVPQLATSSFVATDNMSIHASEEGWDVLAEIQRIDNVIWAAIEKRRANFYAIIYHRLYACAQSLKTDLSFNIAFDTNGFIDLAARTNALPQPQTIKLFVQ